MRPLPTAFDIAKSKGYTDKQILAGFGGEEARNEVLGVKKKKELTEKQIMAGFGGKAAKEKLISGQTKSLLSSAIASLSVIDAIFKTRLDASNQATSQTRLARKEADIERRDATAVKPSETQSPSEVGGKTLIAGLLIGAAIPLFEKMAEMFPGVIAGFKATGLVVLEFVKAIGDGLSYVSKALSVLDPIIQSDTYKWLKGQIGLGGEEQPPESKAEVKSTTQTKMPTAETSPSTLSTPKVTSSTKPPQAAVSTPKVTSSTKPQTAGAPQSKPQVFASTKGLVKAEHAEKTSKGIVKDLTPEGAALIAAISGTESPDYNVIVGSGKFGGPATFSDYSKHPDIPGVRIRDGKWVNVNEPGTKSTAAGKYQITGTTWHGTEENPGGISQKYGLKDFSPESQDKAAWYLAQERYSNETGGKSLQEALMSGEDLNLIATRLNKEWTSLTGGKEESAKYKTGKTTFAAEYNKSFQQIEQSALAESSAMAKAKTKTTETIVITAPATKTAKPSPTTTASLSDSTPDYIKRLVA